MVLCATSGNKVGIEASGLDTDWSVWDHKWFRFDAGSAKQSLPPTQMS